ncbi:MAG: competence protein ComEC [Gemmatales bacterium]|nr:MAG: competence protein ComEC [Gemmatales bacterium]
MRAAFALKTHVQTQALVRAPARVATLDQLRKERVWQAPLAFVAACVTLGTVGDRFIRVPLGISFFAAALSLCLWWAARKQRSPSLPLCYLGSALVALGASWHHWYRDVLPANDIGQFAVDEPQPVHLLGQIVEEPTTRPPRGDSELRSRAEETTAELVLRANRLRRGTGWQDVTGKVRVFVPGNGANLHLGDTVEVFGQLSRIAPPFNPGEFDYAELLHDRGIHAQITVRNTTEAVQKRIPANATWTPAIWLSAVRQWGRQTITNRLGPADVPVACAMLLGDRTTLSSQTWQNYVRTGVVHVLVISGQHLVILSAVLWLMLRFLGVSRRHGAVCIGLVVMGYAFLTGGRPPALRAAVIVCVYCGGIVLRRPALTANSLALAWLVVLALNPTEIFHAGCLLSFLAVAVLYFGIRDWQRRLQYDDRNDPALIVSTPASNWVRALLFRVAIAYIATAGVWLGLAPLVAFHYNLVSPIAIVVGPPMMLLTAGILFSGFLMLLLSVLSGTLAGFWASVASLFLQAANKLVTVSAELPLFTYVSDPPLWWLVVFYSGLLSYFLLDEWHRRSWFLAALAVWLVFGVVLVTTRWPTNELRCTFLAVGHGNCTVIETEDGRVVIYDAGALSGPEVAEQTIAPFLWHRGIRRIDEVFLSHADLDHFNGLPALLDRFPVGQITTTPSFAEKETPGVRKTLEMLRQNRVPVRIVRRGDRLTYGTLQMEVLHPPAIGPEGIENERSLVLYLRHHNHAILLTGDLEKQGLSMLLAQPRRKIDILMAPHHGSRNANTSDLARWARPKLVVSSQGRPVWRPITNEPYADVGAVYLSTWPAGAVTVYSRAAKLVVNTFRGQHSTELVEPF